MGALKVRVLGTHQAYLPTLAAMQTFTQQRSDEAVDELWVLEHEPVFTLGRNGQMEHLLDPQEIPVVKVDRGGQVTYHGRGQLIIYLLLDVRRRNLGVRELVIKIEQAIIQLLASRNIVAAGDREAPGVYVEGKKIAALGLRVSRGKTYHGLSLNVDMDLEPFKRINPCGYAGLEVSQCRDLGIAETTMELAGELALLLAQGLGYRQIEWLAD
ncbi:lipoyl(octanoyl) transferase [Thiothrix eikelboomii]|uniref:Octanoyltransferase n=1 Tax=Thiothrix eikelboomii TaxID=92487 RepID=A0A1T4VXD2_9GAMM|nr:lipoyl(octanoyl) transferase LipB [Thiothrix eikelboomii]SKA69670.1 lipoyl(octanoyl) transferase [Thiothrix eikelboomii]